MDFILVRHGSHEPQQKNGPLTRHGIHQAKTLAAALQFRSSTPDLIITSKLEHSRRTAACVRQELAPGLPPPVELDALTPKGGPGGLPELAQGAGEAGVDLSSCQSVLVVGHEGRLSDLVIELTGRRSYPIPPGGAVCIRGGSFTDLAAGRGCIHYRYPVVDYQEDQLRSKVNSKMTVASLLAGFVLTTLAAVLVLEQRPWPWERTAAIIALTASLVLFVASVYIYDQLSMPTGFWTDADKPRNPFWEKLADFKEARQVKRWNDLWNAAEGDEEAKGKAADDNRTIYHPLHEGFVYCAMVKTSSLVFTPAVILALAGFVALLIGTGAPWIWAGGLAGLAVATVYAACHRPSLGADLSSSPHAEMSGPFPRLS
jgi:phosphohistidine phosphatase SixA